MKRNELAGVKCREYREGIEEDFGYFFCERCGRSDQMRYEVHHIFYRSEKPNHENLHDRKNLIMLCIGCHNYLHSHKKEREKLDKFSGARSLFLPKEKCFNKPKDCVDSLY